MGNAGYEVQAAPVIRQIPELLIEDKTVRYDGFNIGSPVFSGGTVQQATGGNSARRPP